MIKIKYNKILEEKKNNNYKIILIMIIFNLKIILMIYF